jgi:hypothetical protein
MGRAALALGDPQTARKHLEQARSLGFVTPEVDFALGKALAAQYEHALAQLASVPDPALRRARRDAARRELALPARDLLQNGASSAAEPPAFRRAQLALLEGRADEALAGSREAWSLAPWHFESLRLQAQAWLEKARAEPDSSAVETCLKEAEQVLLQVGSIARSDPDTLDLAFQRWQEEVALAWRKDGNPRVAVEAQLRLAQARAELEPHGSLASAWKGRAAGEWARYEVAHGRDPGHWLQVAKAAAERAILVGKGDPEAYAAMASVHRTEGFLMIQRGVGDPEPSLREGLRFASQGLALDSSSVFLQNLQTACLSLLLDHLKSSGRWDQGLEGWLPAYRKAADDHPELAYYQGNLGTVLLGMAALRAARGLDSGTVAREAREAYLKALALAPGHVGVLRGALFALALEARWAAEQGEKVQALVDQARRLREMGPPFSPEDLDVVQAAVELAGGEAARRAGLESSAREGLAAADRCLRGARHFPAEPDLLDRLRLRRDVLAAELTPPRQRPVALAAIRGRLRRQLVSRPQDQELLSLALRTGGPF